MNVDGGIRNTSTSSNVLDNVKKYTEIISIIVPINICLQGISEESKYKRRG